MHLENETAKLLQGQKQICDALKVHGTRLQAIKTLDKSLIEKWQMFLEVILPIQIAVIEKFGFEGNQQGLLQVLLPLHMSVMERHGFMGEEGYVQAQRALMDFYHVPEIMQGANYAQKVVFERARLL